MVRNSLLIFIILLETLQAVHCGNDSLNPFNSNGRKKTELKKSDIGGGKGFLLENSEGKEEKKIEKRRLLFNEGESGGGERDFENSEFSSRRKTNYTITETEVETQIPEYQRGFNNWEDKQNVFPFPTEPGNSRNFPDFRSSQPLIGQTNSNQNLNWRQNTDIFATGQSQRNEEKYIKQIAGPESNRGMGNNYYGRIAQMTSDGDVNGNFPLRNGEVLNRRLSTTSLRDEGTTSQKNYGNDERVGEMKPHYLSHSGMNYYSRNPTGFWNPNFYRPEKGVIINFNTECPAPRQLNNQMVHKFIFTPKSSVSTLPEVSPFQIPETAFISTPKRTPMYYL